MGCGTAPSQNPPRMGRETVPLPRLPPSNFSCPTYELHACKQDNKYLGRPTVCPRKNDPLHCFVIICITAGNFKANFSTALHLLLIHILYSFRSCILTLQILFTFFIVCGRDFISKIFRTKDINRNLIENACAEK